MGGRGRHTVSQVADRAAHDERSRLVGAAGVAALVVGVAVDNGGFDPLSWDRPLIGLSVLVLALALVGGVERPSRAGGVLLGSLAALAAWTALSWMWSASPPAPLAEAQRVALYAAAAAAVALERRRVAVAPGVAAGATVVACWNLAAHGGSGTGAGSQPVGYANGLALLSVLALALLPGLPWPTWAAAVPLALVLVRQDSLGAYAALAVAAVVLVVRRPSLRLAAAAAGVAVLLAAPYVGSGHERTHYWQVAAREARAHPLLGGGAGTFVSWWVRERDVPVSTAEAHSLYVETLAELGPFGLALVLLALAVPLAATRRRSYAACVAAYAVGVAVDFDWELAGVTLPAVLVAAAAASEGGPRREVPLRVVVPAAAALTAAAVLAYAGNAALSRAQDAAQGGDFTRARAEARRAVGWQPWSPQPWVVLGDTATARRERVDDYARAVRLDRSDWSLWQRLARVARGRLRRLAGARAAQLNPFASGS